MKNNKWLSQSEVTARMIVWIAVLVLGCITFYPAVTVLSGWPRWLLSAPFLLFVIAVPIVFNSELRHLRSVRSGRPEKEKGVPHDVERPRQLFRPGWVYFMAIFLLAVALFLIPAQFDRLAIFALVAVTMAYAIFAHRQAEASMKMLEEVKEERLAASQPLITQKAVNKLRDEIIDTGYLSHFSVLNAGNGTAIGLVASILDEKKSSVTPGHRETFLKSGEQIRFEPDLTRLKKGKYYVFCQYIGISNLTGRKSVNQTWLPFNIGPRVNKGEEVSIVTFDLSFEFDVPENDAIKTYIIVPDHL